MKKNTRGPFNKFYRVELPVIEMNVQKKADVKESIKSILKHYLATGTDFPYKVTRIKNNS